MVKHTYKHLYSIIAGLLLLSIITACGDDDGGDDEPVLDPPSLVSSDPDNGATDIAAGDITMVLTFDQNVTCPSSGHGSVTLGDATISSVSANLTKVTVEASGLEKGKDYQLIVPEDVILGPTKIGASQVTVGFSTVETFSLNLDTSLVTKDPMQQAKNVYDFFLDNYGENMVSGAMSNVAWNINEAKWVKQHTGKYPAIATFDYIFLHYSPADWIDYSDISVLEDWWSNNGLVSAGWHWVVPPSEGSTSLGDYTYSPDRTTFEVSNATVSGTWENTFVNESLAEIAGYLKLLQQKNIPVIWRPLHEAAGNIYEYDGGEAWFWWGADGAETYKTLWRYVFDYFQTQGLNNLIWVWTTQTKDSDFYPGDDYVDIIGRDVYNNTDVSDIAAEFAEIQENYPNKMVTLSELGNVVNISEQWDSGAKWSYFMPWYDYDRTQDPDGSDFLSTDHDFANAAWWENAVGSEAVITRDEMPDLK